MQGSPNEQLNKCRAALKALEGDHEHVEAPAHMREKVYRSIETYTVTKALLELHVLGPGLLFGVTPDTPSTKNDEGNITS